MAFLLPRGHARGGPLGFPVNKTAVAAGISSTAVGTDWRLHLVGERAISLSREQLLALPQHTYDLPIACVEGWSTTQRWTGVRLRDLAEMSGVPGPAEVTSRSLEHGTFGHATLGHEQVADEHSLLALRVNGLISPSITAIPPGSSARLSGRALHEVGGEHDLSPGGRLNMVRRFRALYGAGPLHLLALLASFAIAGAAVAGWFQRPRDVVNVLEWFAAAIVLHDLVLLPLYSLLDRVAFGRGRRRIDGDQSRPLSAQVNATPYLRIPAILSGLLLLVFFPVIFGLGAPAELSASGIVESDYLARWLLATGVMLAISGVAYAAAVARANAEAKADVPAPDPAAPAAEPSTPGSHAAPASPTPPPQPPD